MLINEIDQLTRCRVGLTTVLWEATAQGADQIHAEASTPEVAIVKAILQRDFAATSFEIPTEEPF